MRGIASKAPAWRSLRYDARLSEPRSPGIFQDPHGQRSRSHQHGAVLRFRERRARRPGRQVRAVRHRQGARAPAAQGQHRRQEGVLRLGSLQGVQGADARGVVRADRNSARAPVGQEFGRHPHGRRRARPLLHQVARRDFRDHQRRLRFLAAGVQAAREQQGGDRRRRQEFDLRPADRELRRVHLLRRPGARAEEGGVAQGRRQESSGRGGAKKKGAEALPARRSQGRERASSAAAGSEAGRRRPAAGSARHDRQHRRGTGRRARRRRQDLGIDGQAGGQARASPASTNRITASARSTACSRQPSRREAFELERDEKSGGYIVRLAAHEE